jgi:enterochelin esterase-like enzyme
LVHTPYVVAQFRVLNGGHDWDVWRPAFIEGASWIFRFLDPPQ